MKRSSEADLNVTSVDNELLYFSSQRYQGYSQNFDHVEKSSQGNFHLAYRKGKAVEEEQNKSNLNLDYFRR